MSDPDFWEREMHPDDLDRVINEENRCIDEGIELDIEYRLFHRNGDIVWVRDRASVGEIVARRHADGRGPALRRHRPQAAPRSSCATSSITTTSPASTTAVASSAS